MNDADDTHDTPETDSRPHVDAEQLPPVDLTTLVTVFSTQALVAMGLIPHPATNKPERQLPLAQHFIDLLGVLEDKTKGNLTPSEHKFLENSLHELRMVFVQIKQAP